LKKAQSLGIAETDATHDIDGWDAAVKTAALITVLMDVPIRLEEINREGIRNLSAAAVRAAKKEGRPYKLVCRAKKEGSEVTATVRPEQLPWPKSPAPRPTSISKPTSSPASPSPKKILACTRPRTECSWIL
jgi:homoserine dehydrogenase